MVDKERIPGNSMTDGCYQIGGTMDKITDGATPRTEMKCVRCGGFSSARICWNCSNLPDAVTYLRVEQLERELSAAREERDAVKAGCVQHSADELVVHDYLTKRAERAEASAMAWGETAKLMQQRAEQAERRLAEVEAALKPFADEYEIADEAGELQHWPNKEIALCKAAYEALAQRKGERT